MRAQHGLNLGCGGRKSIVGRCSGNNNQINIRSLFTRSVQRRQRRLICKGRCCFIVTGNITLLYTGTLLYPFVAGINFCGQLVISDPLFGQGRALSLRFSFLELAALSGSLLKISAITPNASLNVMKMRKF
jgi:hypothetical protein